MVLESIARAYSYIAQNDNVLESPPLPISAVINKTLSLHEGPNLIRKPIVWKLTA